MISNQQENIEIFLKNMKSKLILVFCFSFILFNVFSHVLTFSYKKSLYDQISESLRPHLINGDNRQSLLLLNKQLNKQFHLVTWVPQNGTNLFSLPSFSNEPFFLFSQKIQIKVFFDENHQNELGTLIFYYSRQSSFTFAFLMWSLFIGFTLYLAYKEKNQFIDKYNTLIQYQKTENLNSIAKQVSHDIRSPLSALNMIISQSNYLPENQRIILRNSVNRINDIANTLLSKSRERTDISFAQRLMADDRMNIESVLIPALIDSIISEKRTQYRDRIGIDIEAIYQDSDHSSYGAFAEVNATEFCRVISNLINNSVEAAPNGNGRIIVSINLSDKFITITISDNGKGIPDFILTKLGQEGVTFEKTGTESGTGLGIYHAKKTIEGFGGTFEIKTKLGFGTDIIIKLLAGKAPDWFASEIIITPGMEVVSLDDDLSIHGIWKGRFQSLHLENYSVQHFSFTSGPEFENWISIDSKTNRNVKRLYLIDYELLQQKNNGVDIVESLDIASSSILVTSRYEEPTIKTRCKEIGLKILPKGLAGFIPITIKEPVIKYDAVLIDDDSLILSAWNISAYENEKKIISFTTFADFLKKMHTIDTRTPIFIDSNLGDGIKGEIVSKKAYELGFKTIFLCTGYNPDDFQPMSWITKIIGKEDIWQEMYKNNL